MEKWLRKHTMQVIGTELAEMEGKHFLELMRDTAEVNWEQHELTA